MVHIQDLVYTYKGNLKLPFWESLVAYIVTTWTGEWREVGSNPVIKKVFLSYYFFLGFIDIDGYQTLRLIYVITYDWI